MEDYNPVDVLDSLSLDDFIDSVADCPFQMYLKVSLLIYKKLRDNIQRLKISQVCVATAMVYFHQFYSKLSSNSEHHPQVVIAACLILACKVENVMRSANSIIHIFFPDESDMKKREQQIYRYELILCEMNDFTLNFPHPYAKLGKLFKNLEDVNDHVRKRFQEVCGMILNQSYASPFYLVFGDDQNVFIASILSISVQVLSQEGFVLNIEKVWANISTEQRNLSETERKAHKCLRNVFLLMEKDSLTERISKAIDELHVCEDNPYSTPGPKSNTPPQV